MKQRKTLVILESSALKRSCQCMCAKDTGDVVAVGVGAMLPDYTLLWPWLSSIHNFKENAQHLRVYHEYLIWSRSMNDQLFRV